MTTVQTAGNWSSAGIPRHRPFSFLRVVAPLYAPKRELCKNNIARCGWSGLRKPVVPAGPVEVQEVWPAIRGVEALIATS